MTYFKDIEDAKSGALAGDPRLVEPRSRAELFQPKGKTLTEYAYAIGWPLVKIGAAIILIWLLQALQLYAMGAVS